MSGPSKTTYFPLPKNEWFLMCNIYSKGIVLVHLGTTW